MANHGLVKVERQMHGVHVPRYLNATGRWAGNGKRVPLLVWETREEAQSAAEIATAFHKKPVTVAERADSSWRLGKAIRWFTAADAAALEGYTDGQ
jgi:hypothetical protein